MASVLYSPIIKGKLNDMRALGLVSNESRSITKAMVEAMPLRKGDDIGKHISRVAHYLVKHVPLGDLYFDFYGVAPGLKLPDGADAVITGFDLIKGLGRTVTPTYGFGRDDSLWPALRNVVFAQGQGFCFRIDIDDLDDQAEDSWAQILERTGELGLKSDNIDLMIDLREIEDEDMSRLRDIVLAFLELKPAPSSYRSVTVTGSSALKTVATIPQDGIGHVARNELLLWSRLQRDLPSDLKLIYGDYGVIHPDFSDQGGSEYMNAKIRYTNHGRITYFRGHGLLHPVKDYDQYYGLAAQVHASPQYCGSAFSHGDRYIDTVASHRASPGYPGSWVCADMNHHLEYTASAMPRLVESVRELEDEFASDELA